MASTGSPMEHLALSIEKDSEAIPSRSHSVIKWAQICHCSTRIFRKFADRAARLKLFECNPIANGVQFASRTQADRVQIDLPKLLKYRDEYSKRSGQTTSKMESRTDTQEIRTESTSSSSGDD